MVVLDSSLIAYHFRLHSFTVQFVWRNSLGINHVPCNSGADRGHTGELLHRAHDE